MILDILLLLKATLSQITLKMQIINLNLVGMNWKSLIIWLATYFQKWKKINTCCNNYNASLLLPHYFYHQKLTSITSKTFLLGCNKYINHHKNSHATDTLIHKIQYVEWYNKCLVKISIDEVNDSEVAKYSNCYVTFFGKRFWKSVT